MDSIREVDFLGDCVGGYAQGFLDFAFETLGVTDPDRVLHLFGGGLKRGITVDIRPDMNPTYCCDVRSIPLENGTQDWIMADPPLSDFLNSALYGIDDKNPTELELMLVARRLLKIGGAFGVLHFIVPPSIDGLTLEKTYAVIHEPGRCVAGWHVMRRT
jgi:hypothetical protein